MITSTFIIAAVAYIVFSLAFGLIWNEVVFKKQFRAMTLSISREKPIIPLGLLAISIQAIAISILFSLFAKGVNPITEGLLFGLLLGSYSIVDDSLVTPARFLVSPVWTFVILQLSYGIIKFGLAGIIVAYIFA